MNAARAVSARCQLQHDPDPVIFSSLKILVQTPLARFRWNDGRGAREWQVARRLNGVSVHGILMQRI